MLKFYTDLISNDKIRPDERQKALAEVLDSLKERVIEVNNSKKSFFSRIFSGKDLPKGLYIHGKVGRGKSMLMDGFYDLVPIESKKRVHFHEFMQEIHEKIHDFRQEGTEDPVIQTANSFSEGLLLLCFDEFEVNDVTDAMILSKLFRQFIKNGLVMIFTSNKEPEEHYQDGLQRHSYLDFCRLLRGHVDVFSLNSKQDYRQLKANLETHNYFTPLGYAAISHMKERFKSLSDEHLDDITINVKGGREIHMRGAGKIGWASFHELCEQALGAPDYIELTHIFDILFLEAVPVMSPEMRNEAKRFVKLIDVLYDNGTKLVINAQAEPNELYVAGTGKQEFKRTASRLTEMRSWG